jgi:hypothetical protein
MTVGSTLIFVSQMAWKEGCLTRWIQHMDWVRIQTTYAFELSGWVVIAQAVLSVLLLLHAFVLDRAMDEDETERMVSL